MASSAILQDSDHGLKVVHGFDKFRVQGDSTDFTLMAEGRSFSVHKQLLAVSSDYFQGCFRSGMVETQTNSMVLQSITARGLQQVVDFLYTGKMLLSKKTVQDVLEAAVFLHVQQAVKLCCDYLLSHIKIKTISEYNHLAEVYHLEEFRNQIKEYLLDNFNKFIKSDAFLQLPVSQLCKYLLCDTLRCSEYKLYKALEKWIKSDCARSRHLEQLLCHIRFALMSNEEINRIRKNTAFWDCHILHQLVDEGMSFRCATLPKQILGFRGERTRVRNKDVILSFATDLDETPHAYLLDKNKWLTMNNGLDAPGMLSHASACVVNNFLFVCGGDGESQAEPTSMCFCFRPHTCTWTRISNMKQGRRNFALVEFGNSLYAIGGIGDQNHSLDSVEKYSISENRWVFTCTMGVGLSDVAHCCLRDTIYIAGGLDENCINVTTFKTFLPRISMWQKRSSILNIKFRPKLFSIGVQIYLIDLYRTDGVPAKIDTYDIAADQWSVIDGVGFNFSRYYSAVCLGNWIYFVGRNEVEDGHSKRYNVLNGETEDFADFPAVTNAPLCCVLKLPPQLLKKKVN